MRPPTSCKHLGFSVAANFTERLSNCCVFVLLQMIVLFGLFLRVVFPCCDCAYVAMSQARKQRPVDHARHRFNDLLVGP
jgi:hypothetical protein